MNKTRNEKTLRSPNIARYHLLCDDSIITFFIYSNFLVRSSVDMRKWKWDGECRKMENVEENDMNIFLMKIRQSSSFNLFRYDDISDMKYPWNFSIVALLRFALAWLFLVTDVKYINFWQWTSSSWQKKQK